MMKSYVLIPGIFLIFSCALDLKERNISRDPASVDKCRDNLLGLIPTQQSRGVISEDQIRAAMAAENLPPSLEVTIRSSGSIKQYTDIDRPELVGKKIMVNMIDDRYAPGTNTDVYKVPQMVLTKDYLDPNSQHLIQTIKYESLNGGPQKFREVGGWILYTRNGSYRSTTVTSNDAFAIANGPIFDSFNSALAEAQRIEGINVKLVDLELYHTHYERGEAFSFGDQSFQQIQFHRFRKYMEPGAAFSSYAVPVQGDVLFKSTIRN